jgi:hypothetical protein
VRSLARRRSPSEWRQPLRRRPYSTAPPAEAEAPPASGLWARSKQLAKEHGKVYTAVYFGLSAVDFSLVFAAIYFGGAEHVRQAEDWVLGHLDWRRAEDEGAEPSAGGKLRNKVGDWAQKHRPANKPAPTLPTTNAEDRGAEVDGLDGAKRGEYGSALWTTALLAYGIHKTALLPFRIAGTIGLTPWVVRCARSRCAGQPVG